MTMYHHLIMIPVRSEYLAVSDGRLYTRDMNALQDKRLVFPMPGIAEDLAS